MHKTTGWSLHWGSFPPLNSWSTDTIATQNTRGGSTHAGLNQIGCNMHWICAEENVAMLWIVNPIPNCKLTESNPTNSRERLMQQFRGILSLHCYLLNCKSPGIIAKLWEGKSGYFLHEDYIQSMTFRAQKQEGYTILTFKWTCNGELCINDGWDLHWISLRCCSCDFWRCYHRRQRITLSLFLLCGAKERGRIPMLLFSCMKWSREIMHESKNYYIIHNISVPILFTLFHWSCKPNFWYRSWYFFLAF